MAYGYKRRKVASQKTYGSKTYKRLQRKVGRYSKTGKYTGTYARSLATQTKGLELKNFDLNTLDTAAPVVGASVWTATKPFGAPNTTGQIVTSYSLNQIPQGTSANQREGRRCTIKKIQVKALVTCPETTVAADTAFNYRLMLVLDKQANGAIPNTQDLFQLNTAGVNALYNLDNSQRFTIIADKTYSIESSGAVGATSARATKTIQWNIKANIPLEFSGTTGAVSEIRSNNLLLVNCCDALNAVALQRFTSTRVMFVG